MTEKEREKYVAKKTAAFLAYVLAKAVEWDRTGMIDEESIWNFVQNAKEYMFDMS